MVCGREYRPVLDRLMSSQSKKPASSSILNGCFLSPYFFPLPPQSANTIAQPWFHTGLNITNRGRSLNLSVYQWCFIPSVRIIAQVHRPIEYMKPY